MRNLTLNVKIKEKGSKIAPIHFAVDVCFSIVEDVGDKLHESIQGAQGIPPLFFRNRATFK
jgi:hypothetical protein